MSGERNLVPEEPTVLHEQADKQDSCNVKVGKTKVRPFKCNRCEKEYERQPNLDKHKEIAHGEKKCIPCNYCKRTFTGQMKLDRHMKTAHKDIKPYSCTICDKQFRYERDIKGHLKWHNDKQLEPEPPEEPNLVDKHPDQNCEKEGSSDNIQKTKVPFKCNKCEKEFIHLRNLKYHKRYVHKEYPDMSCKFCKKKLKNMHAFKKHMKTHRDIKPYSCNICAKQFRTKENVELHLQRHHDDLHSCDICKKQFNSKESLEYHCKQHQLNGDEPNLIPEKHEEPQLFSQMKTFPIRKPKLVGKRFEYRCSICEKKFRTKKHLEKHTRSDHKPIKSSFCDICAKQFEKPYWLKLHLDSHSNPELQFCDICKKFRHKSSLQCHCEQMTEDPKLPENPEELQILPEQLQVTFHKTNKKPFPCRICGKRFNQAAGLSYHKRNIHMSNENIEVPK